MFGFLKRTPPFELNGIVHFIFKYSTGNMMYAYVVYNIICENGVYTAKVKPDGVDDEKALNIEIDSVFMTNLEALLISNAVEKWNGFQKSDLNVLDGNHFDMFMRNRQDQRFSASGYMKWPPNYADVKAGLDNLFGQLINKNDE